MNHEQERLTERFEEHRTHRRAVAYRMLGSLSEADDAVQEAWLRLSRSDARATSGSTGTEGMPCSSYRTKAARGRLIVLGGSCTSRAASRVRGLRTRPGHSRS
jgi:RNA polymerase sigma-70 factor (ECF subfamily)